MAKWRIQIQVQIQRQSQSQIQRLLQTQIQVLPEDHNILKECEEDKDDASAHPDVQG